MNAQEIATMRLQNQQLVDTKFKTPKQLVSWLSAVQAQDYAMAKWAIGIRQPGSTNESIEQALDRGDIIRTHVLRPTWHFVSADDIRWMLELTAPTIKVAASFMNRQLELDEPTLKKSNKIIEKSLQGKQLTRSELMAILEKKGIFTNNLRAAHFMLRAELDGIVCNGPMRGKQFTYALLDEKVPPVNNLKKEEALAALAKRYFTSHGPATLADFAWWSGLSITNARSGLEMVKPGLTQDKCGQTVYWFHNSGSMLKSYPKTIHLLPSYDEFIISYKDRAASLEPAYLKNSISGNGIFKPVILVNGKVEGIWKRTIKKDKLVIETVFFKTGKALRQKAMKQAAHLFENFLSLKSEIFYG